ncbi:MAG: DUF4440 domain-containing protein [Bacillota bacterium]
MLNKQLLSVHVKGRLIEQAYKEGLNSPSKIHVKNKGEIEMDEIKKILNEYFQAWNKGFTSKNGDEIRNYMSKSFVGYWANSNIEKPDPYYYEYDLNSVLKQMDDAEKSFNDVSIIERKNGDEFLISGRETNLINGEPYTAQCMFVWRKEENEWKLLREYIELER